MVQKIRFIRRAKKDQEQEFQESFGMLPAAAIWREVERMLYWCEKNLRKTWVLQLSVRRTLLSVLTFPSISTAGS